MKECFAMTCEVRHACIKDLIGWIFQLHNGTISNEIKV